MFGVPENLNLKFWISQKDVRKYLQRFLSKHDSKMIYTSSSLPLIAIISHVFDTSEEIEKGYLKLLMWRSQYPNWVWINQYTKDAVVNGHLEILEWALHSDRRVNFSNEPIIRHMCNHAAYEGHLKILQWARDHGAPWDKYTCAYAACRGHLEILKWAWENGAPWNSTVTEWAAHYNQIETLKWALANGAPWNYQVIRYAEKCNDQELVAWAKENIKKILL